MGSKKMSNPPPPRTDTTGWKVEHTYDDHGNHRLSHQMAAGPWSVYQGFAMVALPDGTVLYAATDYWNGVFPVDKPFKIVPIDTNKTLTTENFPLTPPERKEK